MSRGSNNMGRPIGDNPASSWASRSNTSANNSPRSLKSAQTSDDGILVLWSSNSGEKSPRSSSESSKSLGRAQNTDVDGIRVLWSSDHDGGRPPTDNKEICAREPRYELKRPSSTHPSSSKPKIMKKD